VEIQLIVVITHASWRIFRPDSYFDVNLTLLIVLKYKCRIYVSQWDAFIDPTTLNSFALLFCFLF